MKRKHKPTAKGTLPQKPIKQRTDRGVKKPKKIFSKGDILYVISGPNKGKYGKLKEYRAKKQQVYIEGVNMGIKHQKPTENQSGSRAEVERPLHVSNVMLNCPNCNTPTRIGHRMVETMKDQKTGKTQESKKKARLRVCRRCGRDIDPLKN
jgi:large subunit ribosomal protein L24